MKKIISIVCLCLAITASAQEKKEQTKTQIVEASCGQCQFGMKEKRGCDLAVRIDGISYFVDGSSLDAHGDAHEVLVLVDEERSQEHNKAHADCCQLRRDVKLARKAKHC